MWGYHGESEWNVYQKKLYYLSYNESLTSLLIIKT